MKIHEACILFQRRIDRSNFPCVVEFGPPCRITSSADRNAVAELNGDLNDGNP